MSARALAYVLRRTATPTGAYLAPSEKLLWILLADGAIDMGQIHPLMDLAPVTAVTADLTAATCMAPYTLWRTMMSLERKGCIASVAPTCEVPTDYPPGTKMYRVVVPGSQG